MKKLPFAGHVAIWIAALLTLFYEGWILTHLWSWFIQPFTTHILTVGSATGLVLAIKFFTRPDIPYLIAKEESYILNVIYGFVTPTVYLIFGYLIQALV